MAKGVRPSGAHLARERSIKTVVRVVRVVKRVVWVVRVVKTAVKRVVKRVV